MEAKKKIIIHLEGGVVHDISDIPPDCSVTVYDYDVEGLDEDRVVTLDNGREAVVSEWEG